MRSDRRQVVLNRFAGLTLIGPAEGVATAGQHRVALARREFLDRAKSQESLVPYRQRAASSPDGIWTLGVGVKGRN